MNYKKALFDNKDTIYFIMEEEVPEEIQELKNTYFNNHFNTWYSTGEPVMENSIEVKFTELFEDEFTFRPNFKEILENKLYPPAGTWRFAAKTRVYDQPLKVIRALPLTNNFGKVNFHILEDEEGNEYIWSTTSRLLEMEKWYSMSFTIKELKTYHNKKQTVITNPRSIRLIEKNMI